MGCWKRMRLSSAPPPEQPLHEHVPGEGLAPTRFLVAGPELAAPTSSVTLSNFDVVDCEASVVGTAFKDELQREFFFYICFYIFVLITSVLSSMATAGTRANLHSVALDPPLPPFAISSSIPLWLTFHIRDEVPFGNWRFTDKLFINNMHKPNFGAR